jgi:hypothetical protein
VGMVDPKQDVVEARSMVRRLRGGNEIVLAPVLSLIAFILIAVGDTSVITRLLAMLVQALLFTIVVTAQIQRRRLRRFIFLITPILALVFVTGVGVSAELTDFGIRGGGVATGLSALLALGVMIRLFGEIGRAPVINIFVVGTAVSVYLMLGLFFAYIYLSIDAFANGDFFVQGSQPATTFLYYSYITLTTVGYGDFTAASTTGRMSSILEALVGQIYLVTVLALIVSNLGRQRKAAEGEATAADGND